MQRALWWDRSSLQFDFWNNIKGLITGKSFFQFEKLKMREITLEDSGVWGVENGSLQNVERSISNGIVFSPVKSFNHPNGLNLNLNSIV